MKKINSELEPVPRRCSWELTLGCNLSCSHCGSSAGQKLSDELNTEEAFSVADQLSEMGCQNVTLLGGEPFLRDDWDKIASRLVSNGIETTLISNGVLVDDSVVHRLRDAGVRSLGLSVDGLENTHNRLRGRNDAFEKVLRASELAVKAGISVCAVTVVLPENFHELNDLARILESRGAKYWQLQLPIPCGRYKLKSWLKPETAKKLVDFIAEVQDNSNLLTYAGCNVGYLGDKEEVIRTARNEGLGFWTGCYAGVLMVGIRSNGDVTGCLTMPDELTAGNLRDKSLKEIWEDNDSFSYNRTFDRKFLAGDCAACEQSDICRGGCRTMSYYLTGGLYGDPCCELQVG
ncbi:MAG: radical SAM protein [Candidatus Krumholzibacteriota bacterium]|nr:radical SAM protein [Candidatus Krumholzibacteriota bacterium]